MAKRNETAWCCRCRKETTWSGTDRRVHCGGCGTDFPCAHDCSHWDCMEAKGLAAPDEAGILRLVVTQPAASPRSGDAQPAPADDADALPPAAAGDAGAE